MNKNTKGIIAVGATLAIVGVAYFIVKRITRFDEKSTDKYLNESTKAVRDNLGGGDVSKDGSVKVDFFNGKYLATFYTNNRFSINEKGVDGFVKKGTYLDGGKKLNVEDGKTIEGGSVWDNLQKAIK
jgi:hypothetical protein